jgi:hypothetical protein
MRKSKASTAALLGRRGRRTVLLAALLLGLAAGVAYATTTIAGNGGQTIQACANETNGLVRIVAESTECHAGEQSVAWNVRGPQGEPGPAGPQGPAGPPGPQGSGGGPLAYAHVLADGTVDVLRSSDTVLGVQRVAVPGTGIPEMNIPATPAYCFELTVDPRNVVVTTETSLEHVQPPPPPPVGSLPPMPSVFVRTTTASATVQQGIASELGCPAGTEAAVALDRLDGQPFFVSFN